MLGLCWHLNWASFVSVIKKPRPFIWSHQNEHITFHLWRWRTSSESSPQHSPPTDIYIWNSVIEICALKQKPSKLFELRPATIHIYGGAEWGEAIRPWASVCCLETKLADSAPQEFISGPTVLVVPHQGLWSSPLIAYISREVKFLCSLTAMENTSFPHSQLLFSVSSHLFVGRNDYIVQRKHGSKRTSRVASI